MTRSHRSQAIRENAQRQTRGYFDVIRKSKTAQRGQAALYRSQMKSIREIKAQARDSLIAVLLASKYCNWCGHLKSKHVNIRNDDTYNRYSRPGIKFGCQESEDCCCTAERGRVVRRRK